MKITQQQTETINGTYIEEHMCATVSIKKSRFQNGRCTRDTIFVKKKKRRACICSFVYSHRKKAGGLTQSDIGLGYFNLCTTV